MLDFKIVCINLERSTERRQHIAEHVAPFLAGRAVEWMVAFDHRDLTLEAESASTVIGNRPLHRIHHLGWFTGFHHDAERYLEDQVEEFGRKHYKSRLDRPYQLGVTCVHDPDVPFRKWVALHGEIQFYVDCTTFQQKLSMPEIACALSHITVMRKLVAEPAACNAYLVLEDDVSLLVGPERLQAVFEHIEMCEPLWDIVFLNEARFVDADTLVRFTSVLDMSVFSSFTNACSYIIKKSAAETLLNRIERDRNCINLTADDFLSRQIDLRMLRVVEACFSIGCEDLPSNIQINNVTDAAKEAE